MPARGASFFQVGLFVDGPEVVPGLIFSDKKENDFFYGCDDIKNQAEIDIGEISEFIQLVKYIESGNVMKRCKYKEDK